MPTLGRELLTSLVMVFAAAVVVAVTGILLLLPRLETVSQATIYMGSLLAADVVVFAVFGHLLVRRRVVAPLERLVDEVETIASGGYAERVTGAETQEVMRLADAVNHMAERLTAHQDELVANVRSLEETNRELTETRDELIRMEKMASVGRLAAGIAHEIGNPLGAILGYLGVLGRGADEQRSELFRSAEAEARRIDRIVHGLLDYARPREPRTRDVAVTEVVVQTVELLRTQGRFSAVELDMKQQEGLPPVTADFNQLQQVLVNLMINALDAMEGVSAPRLEVATALVTIEGARRPPARRHNDPPEVDYSHRRRFNRTPRVPREDAFPERTEVIQITVTDNGCGIPPEDWEHVFEPFYTTKEPGKGTGLGLAVAARLVDSMRGTIRVTSGSEGGTRFAVLLPPSGSRVAERRDA